MLKILEHSSSAYSPRTYHNAKTADLTIALAEDYSTAGEKLTHKAAGEDKYLALPLYGDTKDPIQAARVLYKVLRDRNLKEPVLNVAGNGIYTLDKKGWTQDAANLHLLLLLSKVHQHWPLKQVVSGGQTGIDLAGIVAAYALGIDAVATLPNGFIQRGPDKRDVTHSSDQIRKQVEDGASLVKTQLEHLPHEQKPVLNPRQPERLLPGRLASKERRFHADGSLPQNGEVLVFGSNLAGRHGRGSALVARLKFGAIYGQGIGRQGQSYAVPTKDGRPGSFSLSDPRATLPVETIQRSVAEFIAYAKAHDTEQFLVVRLGCDLAAHDDADIAPLFVDAPSNCSFPDTWSPWLGAQNDLAPSGKPQAPVVAEPTGCIRVVSKRQGGTRPEPQETIIDGDRQNPIFGNKYHLRDWKDAKERARVIGLHREDYRKDVLAGGPMYQEMVKIADRVRDGEEIANVGANHLIAI